ncbi:hypothetical protein [Rhizobium wenxiniae]|uniref:hypothetical protein n=1 Tax=Rhizobium wenxiniae TaxID=1737357 RepID=UPI003C1E10F2
MVRVFMLTCLMVVPAHAADDPITEAFKAFLQNAEKQAKEAVEAMRNAPPVTTYPHQCVKEENFRYRMDVTNVCDYEVAISYDFYDGNRRIASQGGYFPPDWLSHFEIPGPPFCRPGQCADPKWKFISAKPRNDNGPALPQPTFEKCIKRHLIDGTAEITNVCNYEIRAKYRLYANGHFHEDQWYRLGHLGKDRLRFGQCRPLDGCSPRWDPISIERL